MAEMEVRGENGHNVRVFAETEAEAFELAVAVDPDIEMAGVVDVTGEPVGNWGGDAEEAIARGESIDAGDYQ